MFELIKPGTNIDFVGKRHLWAGLSVVAIVLTIIALFTKGLNYGIDFTGGAEVQIKTPAAWEISDVRGNMESGGLKNVKVQQIGEASAHQFLIKTQGDEKSLNKVSQQVTEIL